MMLAGDTSGETCAVPGENVAVACCRRSGDTAPKDLFLGPLAKVLLQR